MRKLNFIFVFIFVYIGCFAQNHEIELPFIIQNNFSIHSDRCSDLGRTQDLSDTSRIARGCNYLKNLRVGKLSIYADSIITGWDKSFRSSFQFLFGTDKDGKEQLIIDRNNNSDFSDDKVFVTDTIGDNPKIVMSKVTKVSVEYDWVEYGKKVKRFIDVHVFYDSQCKLYLYAFAQHATALLNGKKLDIVPSDDLSYFNFKVFVDSDSTSQGISPNKYLKVNNVVFRVKALDINKNVLIIEKDERPFSKIESAQIGFICPGFTAIDLITKDTVTLEKYRGKYVFIDLWTTWCGPCLADLPKIKEVYQEIDHSKIEFIGIVGEDKPEKINKIINSTRINWKLVEANSGNNIFNRYNVHAFPTKLLIDPNGIVIKTDFRTEELKLFIENEFNKSAKK